jgi:predicted Zn finger-like uncharacterized protein
MTIECGNCGARYNIQDSLIPPQGARVKCKKCATTISVPPPNVTELAAQDLELIPPTPEQPREEGRSAAAQESMASGFERSTPPEPTRAAPSREPDMGLERYPTEPAPEYPANDSSVPASAAGASAVDADDEQFERAGSPERFGSPPSFAEASPSLAASASYEPTMTAESPEATEAEVATESEPAAAAGYAAAATEPEPEMAAPEAAQAASPSSSPAPSGTPLPQGLSPEERSAHEKARRLARVLASDIAIYNRDKKERGIREGNLVAMLGYEIKKSWEIYKERVGSEFANSTPYFRDALNEMLAEGKKIF